MTAARKNHHLHRGQRVYLPHPDEVEEVVIVEPGTGDYNLKASYRRRLADPYVVRTSDGEELVVDGASLYDSALAASIRSAEMAEQLKMEPNMKRRGQRPIEKFFNSYVETALWATTDNADEQGGEPLDKNYDASDIARSTLNQMMRDSVSFLKKHERDIDGHYARAGHDFFLTRGRHGAGFWDGDWPEPEATRLTKAAHAYGEYQLYVGDDGKIYGL